MFGPCPEPGVDIRAFVGISSNRFNPVDAGRIYAKDVLEPERNGRYYAQIFSDQQKHRPGEGALRLSDTMPGMSNIEEIYRRTGWTTDPNTRRPQRPQISPERARGITTADVAQLDSLQDLMRRTESAPESLGGSSHGRRRHRTSGTKFADGHAHYEPSSYSVASASTRSESTASGRPRRRSKWVQPDEAPRRYKSDVSMELALIGQLCSRNKSIRLC